ncbi:MAG: heterodisulfide reductase-related iron-sulfur binding cluster [Desulfobacteraceae bacterium]|nr:heterodisulfide reductase-related iron-sulfur binding cluster [Desulfobacteraceae bacterium]
MDLYSWIKSIVMAAALIGGFGLFFIRVKDLVLIMQGVQGDSKFELNRIPERIKLLFTDVLAQTNVRRKPGPGWAHTFIFFGFLAVQPHSLELMIQGIFPMFHGGALIPGLYGAYLFVADILAFLVLMGLGYAIYRRLFLKPAYLTDGLDARFIILFTAVIIISFHLINAFLLVPSIGGASFDYARYFNVSKAVYHIFNLNDLSPGAARSGFEIVYWIHILTILGFLIYIPGSKHLHLLAAVPNVFLKPLERAKAMRVTDIENEEAETFGLGNISELSWKNVLDLYACTECGRCEEQCPADTTGKPLSPKRIIHDSKMDLFSQSNAILSKKYDSVLPLVRADSPITGDVLWACTTCRACEDICPVNIQHLDIILEARKYQVLMESSFPPEMQETFSNLENQSNPWGFGSDTRADWARGLDVPLMTDNPEADILYYVGCAGSFDDRGKKIAQAMARVLKKAGVNFAILGEEERCNGDVARRAGNEYLAQMMIAENVEILSQYKPKKIVAACPHCFNTIKNEYPHFGAKYEVVHHTEFLLDLFRQGRLKCDGTVTETLTFHDSCYLGRWNGIVDAPRQILQMVNGGRQLIEMARNRTEGFCCGAGGARMFMEETIGKRINHERAEEVMATGAAAVAAACPFCITMLRDGINDNKGEVDVKDIAEIVDGATG